MGPADWFSLKKEEWETVMKKAQTLYVSWESTPLKWHKFLLAITPIRILLALASTVYTFANISADIAATIQAAGGGWAYLWDIAACAVNALVPTIFFYRSAEAEMVRRDCTVAVECVTNSLRCRWSCFSRSLRSDADYVDRG